MRTEDLDLWDAPLHVCLTRILDDGGDTTRALDHLVGTISSTHIPISVSATCAAELMATSSTSRVPQVHNSTSTSSSYIPCKGHRDSISFGGLRKSSTVPLALWPRSIQLHLATHPHQTSTQTSSHLFSALSPSKGLKLLSPKVSLTHSRLSNSSNNHQVATPSSSCLSLWTPSPVPSSVDEEELLGYEEMLQYIKQQQQKKLAHGAIQDELDMLL